MTLERGGVFGGILFPSMQVRLPVAKPCPQPPTIGGEIMAKGKIRDQILNYIQKEGKLFWTVDHLSALRIDPSKLANAHYNMKVQGIIVDSGNREGNKTVWELPPSPLDFTIVEHDESEGVTYHDVGKAVSMLLRKQDEQIASDTLTIKQLTELVAELQVKNHELAEKLNRVTEGRLSAKEITEMNRRASLQ